jgi:hypothetical protein
MPGKKEDSPNTRMAKLLNDECSFVNNQLRGINCFLQPKINPGRKLKGFTNWFGICTGDFKLYLDADFYCTCVMVDSLHHLLAYCHSFDFTLSNHLVITSSI